MFCEELEALYKSGISLTSSEDQTMGDLLISPPRSKRKPFLTIRPLIQGVFDHLQKIKFLPCYIQPQISLLRQEDSLTPQLEAKEIFARIDLLINQADGEWVNLFHRFEFALDKLKKTLPEAHYTIGINEAGLPYIQLGFKTKNEADEFKKNHQFQKTFVERSYSYGISEIKKLKCTDRETRYCFSIVIL